MNLLIWFIEFIVVWGGSQGTFLLRQKIKVNHLFSRPMKKTTVTSILNCQHQAKLQPARPNRHRPLPPPHQLEPITTEHLFKPLSYSRVRRTSEACTTAWWGCETIAGSSLVTRRLHSAGGEAGYAELPLSPASVASASTDSRLRSSKSRAESTCWRFSMPTRRRRARDTDFFEAYSMSRPQPVS